MPNEALLLAADARRRGTPPAPFSVLLVAQIAAAWAAALDGHVAAETHAFDEAGGDSLRLLQLVFALEQATGLTLPLDRFRLDMTQLEMAEALVAVADPSGGPAAPPVFMFPGLGGDEPRLARLRTGVAQHCLVVPMSYGSWADYIQPAFSLAGMIARLAAEVHAAAPTGPLHLAGYSLGGQLAWDVATALRAQGRAVANVVMLDAASPDSAPGDAAHRLVNPADWEATPKGLAEEARGVLAAWRRGDGGLVLSRSAARRLLGPKGRPVLTFLARHPRFLPRRAAFALGFHLTRYLLSDHAKAWRSRRVPTGPVDQPITLLRARNGTRQTRDLGWNGWTTRLRVIDVDGTHFSMFDPPLADGLHTAFLNALGIAQQTPPIVAGTDS